MFIQVENKTAPGAGYLFINRNINT